MRKKPNKNTVLLIGLLVGLYGPTNSPLFGQSKSENMATSDNIINKKQMKMKWDRKKDEQTSPVPYRRRIFPVSKNTPTRQSSHPKILNIDPETRLKEKMIHLTQRLGLPVGQLARLGDQFIITLKKGDEVKLKMDGTYSLWKSVRDESIRLIANRDGIHTILCEKDSSPIFKTTFSSGKYFIVTSHPRRLGIFNFEATTEPKVVYTPKPGSRTIKPWSKIPFLKKQLSWKEEQNLLKNTLALLDRFDLDRNNHTVKIIQGQAVVSLKEGAVLRVKPGYVYLAAHDDDIKMFVDPLNAKKGFHTLQIKRSSLANMEFEEEGDYFIWSYNKDNTYLTYHSLRRPKPIYTPLDYAVDLFEPLDPEG